MDEPILNYEPIPRLDYDKDGKPPTCEMCHDQPADYLYEIIEEHANEQGYVCRHCRRAMEF